MKTALLLIDIQNDYFPAGKMELVASTDASLRAGEALSLFRDMNLGVAHVQHISVRPGVRFFLPGTQGVEIHENVKPMPGEAVIQKNYPNSFRDTRLLEHLQKSGINHLVICGMMTHMCVDATVRAAFDHGFRCTLLHDACASRDLSFGNDTVPARHVHTAFISALAGVYATVAGSKEFITNFQRS